MASLSGRKQQQQEARSEAERSINAQAEIIALKRKAASWGANETEESITSLTGRWEVLANWFGAKVMRQGVIYQSVEHAFQAAKATDPDATEEIRKAASPKEAHALGNKLTLPKDWERRKVTLMETLLREGAYAVLMEEDEDGAPAVVTDRRNSERPPFITAPRPQALRVVRVHLQLYLSTLLSIL